MEWILLFEENSNCKNHEEYFTDYEICSEVRIPGVLEYSDGSLLCGLLSEKDESGLYSYTIRLKHFYKEFIFDKNKFSKGGYYFKDGVIGELMAIFSVYFQARFFLRSTLSGDLTSKSLHFKYQKQFQYLKPSISCNYEMFTDQNRNWAHKNGLKKFLDDIKNINGKYHQSLIQSFHWYSEAIKEIGVDNEFLYIKLVSCVESLITYVKIDDDKLKKKLDIILKKGKFTNSQKREIKNWIGNRKIKQKFIKFIKEFSKGFFDKGYRKAKHCYIKKSDFVKYLKRIYDARSAYIHTGRPMYISFDMGVGGDTSDNKCHLWDLDPSLGTMSDRREIAEKEKLPRMRWFERIVNYSLKKFIEKKYN